jgi:excinuclease UvrABC ATPase subunit
MDHGVIFHYEQGRIHKGIDQSLGKWTQHSGFSNSTWMEQESQSIGAWLLYVQQNTMFTGDARAKWRRKVLRLHFNCKYFVTCFLTTQQVRRSRSMGSKLSVTSGLVQQECSSCCGRTVPRVTSPVPIFFPFLCKQAGKALNLSKAIFRPNATYRNQAHGFFEALANRGKQRELTHLLHQIVLDYLTSLWLG